MKYILIVVIFCCAFPVRCLLFENESYQTDLLCKKSPKFIMYSVFIDTFAYLLQLVYLVLAALR